MLAGSSQSRLPNEARIVTTIALMGDVMLGRLVNESVIQDSTKPIETVWGDLPPWLRRADLRLINLECVISTRGEKWRPETKAFHFRANPRAIEVLRAVRIDGVSLANNHVLDYGPAALAECLARLDAAGIQRTGAGHHLGEALTPMLFRVPHGPVAVVGLTDNEPEWEASDRTPGVHFVHYGLHGLVEPSRSRVAAVLQALKARARVIIVSAHVGPNWGGPGRAMRRLAHECLDLGADLYWGHSNHTPQGIELYEGKVVLYSTGDFIDDYAVDPSERNDLSFLFLVEMDQAGVAGLRLIPTAIDDCRVRVAQGEERAFLERTMQVKCAALGTTIRFQEGKGYVPLRA